MESQFVAYYRVSSQRQGVSGLGLDAQRDSVARYISGGKGKLLAEFTEVESARSSHALKCRPVLQEALKLAKQKKAKLLIAKLDRLARNVHFVTSLMETGVEFVAVDLPQANNLTIHIMAAMAEYESEAISQRTKAALAQAKSRGVRLGNPNLVSDNTKRREGAAAFAQNLRPTLETYKRDGYTQRQIVTQLNALGVKASRGGSWSLKQLQRVIGRLEAA